MQPALRYTEEGFCMLTLLFPLRPLLAKRMWDFPHAMLGNLTEDVKPSYLLQTVISSARSDDLD